MDVKTRGYSPGKTYEWTDTGVEPTDTGVEPTEFATGTNGWLKVPGPVGAPLGITVHGGETMNVLRPGQAGGSGGGVVNWYGDAVFNNADEAMLFVARMQQNAQRGRAMMSAGGMHAG